MVIKLLRPCLGKSYIYSDMEADKIMRVVPNCFEIQVRQGANAQPPFPH